MASSPVVMLKLLEQKTSLKLYFFYSGCTIIDSGNFLYINEKMSQSTKSNSDKNEWKLLNGNEHYLISGMWSSMTRSERCNWVSQSLVNRSTVSDWIRNSRRLPLIRTSSSGFSCRNTNDRYLKGEPVKNTQLIKIS